MVKLYKRIVFFVGLIAMNMIVHAQSGVYYPYFSVSGVANIKPVFTRPFLANVMVSDENWAGIISSSTVNEVSSFTNFPNPAATQTTIAYTLSAKANINLRVIDLAGRQLATLVKQEQAAGKQEYFWDFSKNRITSGMYIIILQVDNKTFSRKMIVQ